MKTFLLYALLLSSIVCVAQPGMFNAAQQPAAPDYSLQSSWSVLPFRQDEGDRIPRGEQWISDSLKQTDVFYIYPTLYMKGNTWNEDLSDQYLNHRIDTKPVRYQATVFNASCRVYVPRYRQAHIQAFYDRQEGDKALDFAYQDVKRAFQYYLDHYNQGRPFIIASHSQGSHHARRLLHEMIDTTNLRYKMVAAYVVGFAIDDTMYRFLKPCTEPGQTGCYVTWASYKMNYDPGTTMLAGNVCINPVSWTPTSQPVAAQQSKGGMLLSFKKKYSRACSTQIYHNILWVRTRMPIVQTMKNLHIADYNLFWFDIRYNVAQRVAAFLKK